MGVDSYSEDSDNDKNKKEGFSIDGVKVRSDLQPNRSETTLELATLDELAYEIRRRTECHIMIARKKGKLPGDPDETHVYYGQDEIHLIGLITIMQRLVKNFVSGVINNDI